MLSRRLFLGTFCATALTTEAVLAQAPRAVAPIANPAVPMATPPTAMPPTASGAPVAPITGDKRWKAPSGVPRTINDANVQPAQAVSSEPRQPIAQVNNGPDTLPGDAGQVWRDYDISPYTTRVTSTKTPERAILDWILRETGYETWHTQPLAMLSIDSRKLRVYHTPEMHAVVGEMVDRFVNTEAESHAFNMRVITLKSPDWRAKAHRVLRPVTTQTQGVQAWLLAKEEAALLVADLRRRSDFQEHSTPHLLVNNGQSANVGGMRARNYVRDIAMKTDAWGGFQPQVAQFDEGFKIEFSPLLSLDSKLVDAVIRCEVDQIEKMIPVQIDVSTPTVRNQRTKLEVPQAINSRLHERFRWPVDSVLLISLGVGPAPVAPASSTLGAIMSSPRADLLVFVESKGKVATQPSAIPAGVRDANTYRNRY